MKEIITKSLKKLISDRYLLVLISAMLLITLILSVIIGFSIHPSELQLVSHYSAFGVTHLYRDQWFYLYVFVVFGLIVSLLHSVIAIKMLVVKDHSIAVMFAWLGIGIIFLGWITAMAILNVWIPL